MLFITKNKTDLSRRQVLKAAGAINPSVEAPELIAAKEANTKPFNLATTQQAMENLQEEHLVSEFQAKSTEAAVNYPQLQAQLDQLRPSDNIFVALHVDGISTNLFLRTDYKTIRTKGRSNRTPKSNPC